MIVGWNPLAGLMGAPSHQRNFLYKSILQNIAAPGKVYPTLAVLQPVCDRRDRQPRPEAETFLQSTETGVCLGSLAAGIAVFIGKTRSQRRKSR